MEGPRSTSVRDRDPRNTIGILERKLGFFTERGLSRTPSSQLSEGVKIMVEAIDRIKKGFSPCTAETLKNSKDFERAWKYALWESKDLWPGNKGKQTGAVDGGIYPRPLDYNDPTDRQKCVHCYQPLLLNWLTQMQN